MRMLDDARVRSAYRAGPEDRRLAGAHAAAGPGALGSLVPRDAELWLDGGHNPVGRPALAQAFSDLNDRVSRPLVLIWGMLNSKDAARFIGPFAGIAHRVVAITIPDEANAVPAEQLAETARSRTCPPKPPTLSKTPCGRHRR